MAALHKRAAPVPGQEPPSPRVRRRRRLECPLAAQSLAAIFSSHVIFIADSETAAKDTHDRRISEFPAAVSAAPSAPASWFDPIVARESCVSHGPVCG